MFSSFPFSGICAKKEGLACGEEVRKDLGLGAGPVERDGVGQGA